MRPSGRLLPRTSEKRKAPADAEQAADHRSDKTAEAERADAQLKKDDERGSNCAAAGGGPLIKAEWAEEPAGDAKNENKEQTKSK